MDIFTLVWFKCNHRNIANEIRLNRIDSSYWLWKVTGKLTWLAFLFAHDGVTIVYTHIRNLVCSTLLLYWDWCILCYLGLADAHRKVNGNKIAARKLGESLYFPSLWTKIGSENTTADGELSCLSDNNGKFADGEVATPARRCLGGKTWPTTKAISPGIKCRKFYESSIEVQVA